jgi:hypothetical protein
MTQAEKLQAAIEWLGTRWVGHPVNRVERLKEPLPEVYTWLPKVLKKGAKK